MSPQPTGEPTGQPSGQPARQRVSRVMQERNEKQKRTTFDGAQYSLERLFGGLAVNETLLYAGGIVLRRRAEAEQQQGKDEIHAYARAFLHGHYDGPSAELVLDKVYYYDMLLSIDFESAWGYEVGVYDRSSRALEERHWREGVMGQLVAISSAGASTPTKHQLIVNFDAQHRPSVVMHTFQHQGSVSVEPEASSSLRVLTYNVWNTNPPGYASKSPAARWKRYTERMSHLCEVIRAQDADVLLLQEVRLDSSFRGSKLGSSGSQLELLLECLSLVEKRWQFIFAPAMSMADKSTHSKARLEEGLAILTRHALDPGSIEVLLLPRNLVDASDDHSRMVLRATVSTPENIRIDAMTTHFPLAPASREKAVDFIFASPASAYFQVLAGDLNAEPFEECLQSLTMGSSRPFVDAWLNADGDEEGLTFPACRPVKRIDYVLVRNSSVACGVVKNVAIVGQRSKEEEAIGERIPTRPETGMLDDDSLLWASDHYGLRADLVLLPRCHLDGDDFGHVSDEL